MKDKPEKGWTPEEWEEFKKQSQEEFAAWHQKSGATCNCYNRWLASRIKYYTRNNLIKLHRNLKKDPIKPDELAWLWKIGKEYDEEVERLRLNGDTKIEDPVTINSEGVSVKHYPYVLGRSEYD